MYVIYLKPSSEQGGLSPKKSAVLFPYKHVIALGRSAHTRYIFPTLLMPIFKFFLKSKKFKSFMILPNSHSTVSLTELISALYASIIGVKTTLRYRACMWTRKGYAGSPNTHMGSPVGENAFCPSSWRRLEPTSILASCLLPSARKIMTKMFICETGWHSI